MLTVDGTSLSSRVGDAVIFVSFSLSIELTMGLTIARSTFPACSSSCLDCSWWDQEYPPPGSASPSWEQQTSGDRQVKRVSTHTGFTLNYYKVFQEIAALYCQHSGVLVTWIQSPPGHFSVWSSRTQRSKAVSWRSRSQSRTASRVQVLAPAPFDKSNCILLPDA